MFWLLTVAWAGHGVVVQVDDAAELLQGTPKLELVDAAGEVHSAGTSDDGVPPDAQAGDRVWSGVVDQVVGPEVVLAVTDDRGHRWTGSFELSGTPPSLKVAPTHQGGLRASRGPSPPGGHAGSGVPPDPTWTDSGALASRPAPWGLLVWAAGLGFAALVLFWWADPGRVPGPGQTLKRIHLAPGPPRLRFLVDRARFGPLIIAGTAPDGVEDAVILGPGRVDVDDLLLALVGLQGRPQVAITGELEGAGGVHGEAALLQLAERLPENTDAFVLFSAG
jgi:hypothetical protein